MQAVLPYGQAVLDDPAEWPAFGRAIDADPVKGRWESQVVVDGMHCAACALAVEEALGRVQGVERVDVSAASQRARIVWSAAVVRPSRWFEAAAAAGYSLVPAGDMFARARRMGEARLALWRWLVAGFCMMQVMMYAYPAYVARAGDMSSPDVRRSCCAGPPGCPCTLPVVLFSCRTLLSQRLAETFAPAPSAWTCRSRSAWRSPSSSAPRRLSIPTGRWVTRCISIRSRCSCSSCSRAGGSKRGYATELRGRSKQ